MNIQDTSRTSTNQKEKKKKRQYNAGGKNGQRIRRGNLWKR